MGAGLTTRIKVKDQDGRVIDEKEVATYAGLLAKAHEEGLKEVTTKLLQIPAPDNGTTAIVEAVVETGKGRFSGIGDASPGNVNRRIAAHVIRMAETRAKARALRDAVNIGMVSLEELGGEEEVDAPPAPPPRASSSRPPLRAVPSPTEQPQPEAPARREAGASRSGTAPRMTDAQRRYLYRFLAERGFEGQAATDALCRAAEVQNINDITKADASALIDAWKRDNEAAGG